MCSWSALASFFYLNHMVLKQVIKNMSIRTAHLFLAALLLFVLTPLQATGAERPRVIVTTDGEIDDRKSMTHLMYYLNNLDIEGIVTVNSTWQTNGHGTGWIKKIISAYENSLPKLREHDLNYPSPDYLRSVLKVGHEASYARTTSEGSNHIVNVLLGNDSRPVWILAWGGVNTIAAALETIKNQHPAEFQRVQKKAKIYAITLQEPLQKPANIYPNYNWILKNYPDITFVANTYQYAALSYPHRRKHSLQNHEMFTANWIHTHVKSHGALGASYTDNTFEESDAPSFFYMLPNGLNDALNPSFGSWGGRFKKVTSVWGVTNGVTPSNLYSDGSVDRMPVARWIPDLANDFKGRADWAVKGFNQANHAPIANLRHAANLEASPGQTVYLDASNSVDQDDGDKLSYEWWCFKEAGTLGSCPNIAQASSSTTHFTAPSVSSAKTLHFIVEVSDNGSRKGGGVPSMKTYKRVVVNVQPDGSTKTSAAAPSTSATEVLISSTTTQNNTLVSDSSAAGEQLTLVNAPSTIPRSGTVSVTVDYSAAKTRELMVNFQHVPSSTWHGGKQVTVEPGSGRIELVFNVFNNPTSGNGYRLVAEMRPPGGNWQSRLVPVQQSVVVAESTTNTADTEEVVSVAAKATKATTASSDSVTVSPPVSVKSTGTYFVQVDYAARAQREIIVDFQSKLKDRWHGGKKVKVPAGTGSVILAIEIKGNPSPGNHYRFVSSIKTTDRRLLDRKWHSAAVVK